MVEVISYRNKIVVVINGIIATKILLQYMIFITKTNFVSKTYCHGVYCNNLQQLTFVMIKVYYNEMKVIAIKNFVATNIFSCSDPWKIYKVSVQSLKKTLFHFGPQLFYTKCAIVMLLSQHHDLFVRKMMTCSHL